MHYAAGHYYKFAFFDPNNTVFKFHIKPTF